MKKTVIYFFIFGSICFGFCTDLDKSSSYSANTLHGLKPPYVTRVLGLNNLAPDIVEAIVAGTEPDGLSIAQIMKNIPEDWNEQRRLYGFPER